MENKNKKMNFNLEKEYDFYMNRYNSFSSKEEKEIGSHLENYKKTSLLYNPIDVNYSKEELKEKLQKLNEIKNLLEKQLEGE